MYNHVKKLAAPTLPLLLALILSACGGAPADEPSNSQSSVINKPTQPSSIDSSSPQSSVMQSSSLAISSSTSIAASSLPSSSTDSYTRASRSSNSSSASQLDTDSTPPETTELVLYRLSENSITLIWDDAIDDVSISHYNIKRNGAVIATIEHPANLLADQKLLAYTDYSYTITAFDTTGNESEASSVLTIRTLPNANSSQANSSRASISSIQSSSKISSLSSSNNSSKTSSLSSSKTSSLNSSNSSKNASSSSNATGSQKTATLTWTHPSQRENGQYLELDEIGGYEIRYRKLTEARYTYILINSNHVTQYAHANADGVEFEIAVFDTAGIYSRFVKVVQ